MSRRPEDVLQKSIVEFVRAVAPDCLLFSVPNASKRSIPEAMMLRATGMMAGIPDLVLVQPGGRVHFFEVKPRSKTLSEKQKAIRDRLITMGVDCATVSSIEDVRTCLKAWRVSTREAA